MITANGAGSGHAIVHKRWQYAGEAVYTVDVPRRAAGTGRICKACGVSDATGVHVSTRYLCSDCAEERMIANMVEISDKSGPAFQRYVAGLLNTLEKYAEDSLAG